MTSTYFPQNTIAQPIPKSSVHAPVEPPTSCSRGPAPLRWPRPPARTRPSTPSVIPIPSSHRTRASWSAHLPTCPKRWFRSLSKYNNEGKRTFVRARNCGQEKAPKKHEGHGRILCFRNLCTLSFARKKVLNAFLIPSI